MGSQGDMVMLIGVPGPLGATPQLYSAPQTPGRGFQPVGQLVSAGFAWLPFLGRRALPRNPTMTVGTGVIQPNYSPAAGIGGM